MTYCSSSLDHYIIGNISVQATGNQHRTYQNLAADKSSDRNDNKSRHVVIVCNFTFHFIQHRIKSEKLFKMKTEYSQGH